jgi:hypothetical protein
MSKDAVKDEHDEDPEELDEDDRMPAPSRAGRTGGRRSGLEAFSDGSQEARGVLRGPVVLAGAIVAAVVIGAYLYFSDSNSDRWELRCARGLAEARRGVYFPWGTRRIADDAHDPLELPEGVSCASARMGSVQELDRTLAGLLLEAAEHQLQQGGPDALARARRDVERARRLQGLDAEQRRQIDALQADMSYHEAREILRQVERSLWQARRKLEHARSTGAGARISGLEEWLRFVEAETERFRPDMAPVPPGVDAPDSPPTPDRGVATPPPAEAVPPAPPPPEDVFL